MNFPLKKPILSSADAALETDPLEAAQTELNRTDNSYK